MTFTILTDAEGKFAGIGKVTVGGQPIDPAKTYTLATNDFMAGGGDGYDMFGGKEQVTLLGLMLDIFVDEIKALSKDGPFTVATDNRLMTEEAPKEDMPITGEPALYLLAGSLLLMTAVTFVAIRRKIAEG